MLPTTACCFVSRQPAILARRYRYFHFQTRAATTSAITDCIGSGREQFGGVGVLLGPAPKTLTWSRPQALARRRCTSSAPHWNEVCRLLKSYLRDATVHSAKFTKRSSEHARSLSVDTRSARPAQQGWICDMMDGVLRACSHSPGCLMTEG
jgi:hypothetical protein